MPEASGYHGQPLLKPPVWTWEVPVYFFIGGLAGVCALIGAVAAAAGADSTLVRDAHLVAAGGALLSPLLLISDLGRPSRFLNMLRVFKIRSPMSIGAWTLAIFTPAAIAALLLDSSTAPSSLAWSALVVGVNGVAAGTGLVLATYTGVLLGVTALPIWARHAGVLPLHFGASSLGAAASTLELAGHQDAALNSLALVAAAAETIMALALHLRNAGGTGPAIRLGEIGSGFAPLILRTMFSHLSGARTAAAVAAVAGAILTRIGWIAAGRAAAR